jgi:transcriptional regulator with XRE-family HTH domain
MELAGFDEAAYGKLDGTMAEPVFNVGDVVRKLRKERKWSIRKLAVESGIGRMTISDVERNQSNYQKETLEALAKAFGHSGAELEAMVTPRPARRTDDLPAEWIAFTRRAMHLSRLAQGALHMVVLALEEADAGRAIISVPDLPADPSDQPSQT